MYLDKPTEIALLIAVHLVAGVASMSGSVSTHTDVVPIGQRELHSSEAACQLAVLVLPRSSVLISGCWVIAHPFQFRDSLLFGTFLGSNTFGGKAKALLVEVAGTCV